MDEKLRERLAEMSQLEFTGKGEAFVESRFITPLLECLGYEQHKDYEVKRHGDDGASFKLKSPPVESGAVKVKHYNPDFIPTIRKKIFWIIEAKSPKDVPYPFDLKYIVQGLQYCIHPEIQAKYLIVSNGADTAVYDAFGGVFLSGDVYAPVLHFRNTDLAKRWNEIYRFLSVETLRSRLEGDLQQMYEKLCLSSLDKEYPDRIARKMLATARDLSGKIEKHVRKLSVEDMDKRLSEWQASLSSASVEVLYGLMDLQLGMGKSAAQHFVEKSLQKGQSVDELFERLTADFEIQSIFHKEQTIVAVCVLMGHSKDTSFTDRARSFLKEKKEGKLSLLTRVECACMRVIRKRNVIVVYPELRAKIAQDLKTAPEITRYVDPPTALKISLPAEVYTQTLVFRTLLKTPPDKLEKMLEQLLALERTLEESFKQASAKLTSSEQHIVSWAYYGTVDGHPIFGNIMKNFGIEV